MTATEQETERDTGLVGLAVLVGMLALLAYISTWALIMVLGIVVIIFLHELGHYVMAKRAGMKVTEFFIGFGPRIWSFSRGETTYGVKAIWAGAYVRIIGMNNIDEVDPADEPRTYRAKSYPKRLGVAVAGSTVHFILAILLLFALFVGYGIPSEEVLEDDWIISEVTADSAAGRAGLQEGDRILTVEGRDVSNWDDLVSVVEARPDESVTIVVERDGAQVTSETTLGSRTTGGTESGFLGVRPSFAVADPEEVGVAAAAGNSVVEFGRWVGRSVEGIVGFFSPSNLSDFVGRLSDGPNAENVERSPESRPVSVVGVVDIGAEAGSANGWNIVFLLAIFNVFIGVFNLAPVLPLDGGHVAIATYERLRSRDGRRYVVQTERLLPVVYGVFAFLVFLGLGALWLDLGEIFSG